MLPSLLAVGGAVGMETWCCKNVGFGGPTFFSGGGGLTHSSNSWSVALVGVTDRQIDRIVI